MGCVFGCRVGFRISIYFVMCARLHELIMSFALNYGAIVHGKTVIIFLQVGHLDLDDCKAELSLNKALSRKNPVIDVCVFLAPLAKDPLGCREEEHLFRALEHLLESPPSTASSICSLSG